MCVCLLCAYVSLGPDQASGSEFKFSQRSHSESQMTLFDCMTSGVKEWWWRRRRGQGETTESTDVVIKFKSVTFIQLCIMNSVPHASLSLSVYLYTCLSFHCTHTHSMEAIFPYWILTEHNAESPAEQPCECSALFVLCVPECTRPACPTANPGSGLLSTSPS